MASAYHTESQSASQQHRALPVSMETMDAHQIPAAFRDHCAHLLIPLNVCRKNSNYYPWKCEDERHAYERCQFEEYLLRVKEMDEKRLAEKRQQITQKLQDSGK
eukprot:TRINITY_DN480_c0_g1_i1.p1 TRINITY_DN480_c0_g1~~TRINITY_DN480_c0_g1_i1.p1  ORF type:complete len:104 (-),score=22.61 TRINITY_DN480_c0_g1_i1:183-494(-)